jgi:hypothetical protein
MNRLHLAVKIRIHPKRKKRIVVSLEMGFKCPGLK